MDREVIISEIEKWLVDDYSIIAGIEKSFNESVSAMKLVRKEKHWTNEHWMEWHDERYRHKAEAVAQIKLIAKVRNETIEKFIELLKKH